MNTKEGIPPKQIFNEGYTAGIWIIKKNSKKEDDFLSKSYHCVKSSAYLHFLKPSFTVQGWASRTPYPATCLSEQVEQHSLSLGIVDIWCVAHSNKSNVVSVIQLNTNSHNMWIR